MGFQRGWKQMLRNSHGVEKIVSWESRGYVAQEICVFDFAKFLKLRKFASSEGLPKARELSASGGLRPLTSHQGLCPGPRWGQSPQSPYRLELRALAMCPGFSPLPQLKIPGAATGCRA